MILRRTIALTAVAMVLTACSGPSTVASRGAATQRWIATTGLGGTIATLQRTTATVERLVTDPTSSSNDRQTVCSVLLLGVQQANGDLPAPNDEVLSSLLASAYSKLGAAATTCGTAGFGPTQAVTFERDRHQGLAALSQAAALAEAVMGRPLSTSTTFPSDPSSAA